LINQADNNKGESDSQNQESPRNNGGGGVQDLIRDYQT